MTIARPWFDVDTGPEAEFTTAQITLLQWFKFLNPADGERIELVVMAGGKLHRVAYAMSLSNVFKLAAEAEREPGFQGAYCVPNILSTECVRRCKPNLWWGPGVGRARDADVTHRRVVYIDVDSVREKGVNATADEKEAAGAVASQIESALLDHPDLCRCNIGPGMSGNGASLFVALHPKENTDALTSAIKDLLTDLAEQFDTPAAKIDRCVHNASRLVPLFGTHKRKWPHSPERPHRFTAFNPCPCIRRVFAERLFHGI